MIEDDTAGDDNKDDNKENNADADTEGDEDAGADEVEGDDDEEVSDLDAFLDCFTTVYELVQSALGGGDNAKGGDNNNDGGKGAVEEPSAIFMRNYTATEEDGATDTESTGTEPQEEDVSSARRIARRFWNGVQGVLGDIAGDMEVDGKPLIPEP